jgi:lipopolysaccharide/colanic/teichoic acid biosynthesis glycosyltransferase
MYKQYIKRLISVIISAFGLVILFPLMLIITIIIRIESKGSPVFKQKRIGRNQIEFTIYKFRTMIDNAYFIGGASSYDGDPRITKVGAFLRKTSLDETLQLINILKGEMNIIGPRPILKEEFEPYKGNAIYIKRFDVSPGLFCTVDVIYRATASREIQFEMDAKYVDDCSLILDIEIFLKTLITVLKRKNVYKEFNSEKCEEKSIK